MAQLCRARLLPGLWLAVHALWAGSSGSRKQPSKQVLFLGMVCKECFEEREAKRVCPHPSIHYCRTFVLFGAGGCFTTEVVSYSQPEFPTPKQRPQGSGPRALHPGSGEHRNPSDHPKRFLCASCKDVARLKADAERVETQK